MLIALVSFGSSLVSRGRGAEIRETILMESPPEAEIVLDFADVARASYSFVDELVGKLFTRYADGELAVRPRIENANETISFHVGQCLERRLSAAV
ncbi:MAG: STAS-like domain-containing protein [Patulibacter sp.]|nr:STAS-like domain-containing protein [Patulibacter sp.]